MALTITNRGTGTHNTSATSFTLSPGSNCTAGATVALFVAADNSAGGGSSNNLQSVTDTNGNTWTGVANTAVVFDNGAANAGVQGRWYTTEQDGGTLTTGSTITVNFGANTTAKTWTLTEVSSDTASVAIRTSGAKAAGATGTALTTGASSSVNVGEVVLAGFCIEAGTTQTCTGDGDTTNGSWSTLQYAEIGSTTSGSCVATQGKVQTTTASTQTYDVTLGISSDYHGAWVIFQEINEYTLACDGGSFTHTGTAAALKYGRKVVAANGSFTHTGTAAALKYGRKVVADAGAFVLAGTAAALRYGRKLVAENGSFAMTGTAAALKVGRKLTAGNGSFTLTGQDATLTVGSSGYTLAANGGSFALTGQAVTLRATRRLALAGASFAMTGGNATLKVDRKLTNAGGSFVHSGAAANLRHGRRVVAGGTSFAETGGAATLTRTRYLTASGGSFTLTGQDVLLDYSGSVAQGEGQGVTIGPTIGIRIG